MSIAYIGIGSNIDPETNILRAVSLLSRHVVITGISTFYRTAAIGRPDDPRYYNGVARIDTGIGPRDLKRRVLARIEADLGRKRTADKSAPRTIDLDLLIYDEMVVNEQGLRIPDPDIQDRAFLALPLLELDRNLLLPGSGKSIREVAERFRDHGMEPLDEYTEKLRQIQNV